MDVRLTEGLGAAVCMQLPCLSLARPASVRVPCLWLIGDQCARTLCTQATETPLALPAKHPGSLAASLRDGQPAPACARAGEANHCGLGREQQGADAWDTHCDSPGQACCRPERCVLWRERATQRIRFQSVAIRSKRPTALPRVLAAPNLIYKDKAAP